MLRIQTTTSPSNQLIPRVLFSLLSMLLVSPTQADEPPFRWSPAADDFQVNTYTTGFQSMSDVAEHDGGFVVVWESDGSFEPEDPGTTSIHGRRYDSNGQAIGAPFQVNSYTTGNQLDPAVAAWPDGRFAVVWLSPPQVRASVFSADGQLTGAEFVAEDLSGVPISGLSRPNIAINDESILIIWESNPGPADADFGIVGRRFASDGTSLGTRFQINVGTSQIQEEPTVRMAPDSSFVVSWVSYATADPSLQLRRIASDGAPVGTDFQVNTQPGGYAVEKSALDFAADGSFVVSWTDYASPGDDSSDTAVLARRFDSAGAPQGDFLQINTYTTGEQFLGDLRVEPGGGFLVSWSGIGSDPADSDQAVIASRFDSAGQRMGADFLVNTYTTGGQGNSTIGMNARGDFLVVWESDGSAGTDTHLTSIQARRFITEADVSVTKTNNATSVEAGGTTTYEIVVTNDGPDTATGVRVTDLLPSELTCAWSSLSTQGATGNTVMGSGDLDETLLMPPSSAVTYTLLCDIDPGATGTLSNTVDVVNDQVDTNAANDSATDMDAIIAADLALALTTDILGPGPGDVATLTATVTNHGPFAATGVTISSPLPAGLIFESSSDCTAEGGVVSCDAGSLDTAAEATASFDVRVDAGAAIATEIQLDATVAGQQPDPVSANDSASVTLTVTEILLQIDVTDAASVVIRATSAASAAEVTTTTSFNGITLLDFFTGGSATYDELVTCGGLEVLVADQGTTRAPLFNVFVGSFAGGWTLDDLNFNAATPSFEMAFNTLDPAFTGQVTQDLSAASGLPPAGTTGTLISGEPDSPTVIGRWEVITSGTPSDCLILNDSFESGDTSRWSLTIP